MDLRAELTSTADAETLFWWVEDLDRYPQWLSIVTRTAAATCDDGDAGPAWYVDLRARMGPLSRSKRMRMVRTWHRRPHEAVFERVERDGQEHAAWVLRATVSPEGEGSRLTMYLHYSGRLWEPVVERLLREEIEACRERLLALVA